MLREFLIHLHHKYQENRVTMATQADNSTLFHLLETENRAIKKTFEEVKRRNQSQYQPDQYQSVEQIEHEFFRSIESEIKIIPGEFAWPRTV